MDSTMILVNCKAMWSGLIQNKETYFSRAENIDKEPPLLPNSLILYQESNQFLLGGAWMQKKILLQYYCTKITYMYYVWVV